MSMSPTLFQMFAPSSAKTDAELAGHMMRMVALWPLVREDIGMGKVEQAMKILQASGIEPGSEAYAQAHEQQIGPLVERYNLGRRGIPGRIPYSRLVAGEEFRQRFPEQYGRLTQQITEIAEPFLTGASPETRDRNIKALLAQLASNQLPMRVMPDGTFQLDAAAVQRQMQDIMRTAIQTAATLPQTTTFGKFLASNHPDLSKMAEAHPLLRTWLSMPVDEREPHKVMGGFVGDLRQQANDLLASAQMAVKVMEIDPSPSSLARASSVLTGLEQAIALGAIPRQAAQALLSMAQAYRTQAMRVVMPDGRETYRNGLEAQEFINKRTQFLIETQVAPLATALAHNPVDPALQKRKHAVLAQALKEGVDLNAVLGAIYGDKRIAIQQARMDLATAGQRLANARQEAVAQGINIDMLRIRRDKDKQFYDAIGRVVKAGDFSAVTPQDRMLLVINGVEAAQGKLDIIQWVALQKEKSGGYDTAMIALKGERDPQRAVPWFRDFVRSFAADHTLNVLGERSPNTAEAARLSVRENLKRGRDVLVPHLIRLRRANVITPVEAAEAIEDYRTQIDFAVKTKGVFTDPREAVSYFQALVAAEKAQPDAASPGWWQWLQRNSRFFSPMELGARTITGRQ